MPEDTETKEVPKNVERRCLPVDDIELRIVGSDKTPILTGYAAKYNKWSVDLGGFREKIKKGAFDEALENSNIMCLKNHDPNLVLGRNTSGTLRLKTNSVGLNFDDDVPDTTTGRDTVEEVRRGDISGCSFSFTIAEDDWKYLEDGTVERTIIKVGEMFDVGPVTFPAYPDTTVSARSLDKLKDTIEKRDVATAEETAVEAEETAEVAEEAKEETEETEDPAIEYISDERMRQCWVGYRKAGRILNRLKQANACDKDRAEVPADKT